MKLSAMASILIGAEPKVANIRSREFWLDDTGTHINAHGVGDR